MSPDMYLLMERLVIAMEIISQDVMNISACVCDIRKSLSHILNGGKEEKEATSVSFGDGGDSLASSAPAAKQKDSANREYSLQYDQTCGSSVSHTDNLKRERDSAFFTEDVKTEIQSKSTCEEDTIYDNGRNSKKQKLLQSMCVAEPKALCSSCQKRTLAKNTFEMASKDVEEFLKSHQKVKSLVRESDVYGRLFRQAAEVGNLKMVKFFSTVEKHIELLPPDKETCTNEGAADDNGMTPLHLAALNGHRLVVQSLVSSGAQVDVQNKNKESPLYLAAQEGHKSVVNILINHGADPFLCSSNEEKTAIDIAAARRHCAVVECLLCAVAWDDKDLNFHKLVMETGVDPNIVDQNGGTMLHDAKDVELVRYLLKFNVLVNARDSVTLNTPLHKACFLGHTDIVKVLLDHGADVDSRNDEQETPLYFSLVRKHFEVTKILLENGANVNIRHGVLDQTALEYAVDSLPEDIVELLLDWGADVSLKDELNSTPLHRVVQRNHLRLSKLLIERGADVNAVSWRGYTPLHYASNKEIVDLLLQSGADPTICDESGQRPIIP